MTFDLIYEEEKKWKFYSTNENSLHIFCIQ